MSITVIFLTVLFYFLTWNSETNIINDSTSPSTSFSSSTAPSYSISPSSSSNASINSITWTTSPSFTTSAPEPVVIDHTVTSITGSNTTTEGTTFSLVCSFRIRNANRPTRVNQFSWARDQQVLRSGSTIKISSDRVPDNDDWWNSTLTFSSVTPTIAGRITCNVTYNESYVNTEGLLLLVIYRPVIQVNPPSIAIHSGQQVTVECRATNHIVDISSSVNFVSFEWFIGNRQVNNSGVYTVTDRCMGCSLSEVTSGDGRTSTLNTTVTSDVIVTCRASKNVTGFVTNVSAMVEVIAVTDVCCNESNADGMSWPTTKLNNVSYSLCPVNTTGMASRRCGVVRGGPEWEASNIDYCVDERLTILQDQLDDLAQGIGIDDAAKLDEVAAEINTLTEELSDDDGMNVGNLNVSVNLIRTLAKIHSTFSEVSATSNRVQSVVSAVSNVLGRVNDRSWLLLIEHQKTVVNPAIGVMDSVDIFGDQLVRLLDSNSSFLDVPSDNLVLQAVQVSATNGVNLPSNNSASNWLSLSFDRFTLTNKTMQNIAKYVGRDTLSMYTVIYQTLASHLPVNSTSKEKLNSGVMSLSVNGLDATAVLEPPVYFVLAHDERITTDNVTANCAFWNYSSLPNGNWSTANCSVVSSNATHTECQCNHLTNFAILMSLSPSNDKALQIISIIGCGMSITGLVLTIIFYAVFWKQYKSHHAAILINFCVALIVANAIFIGGVGQTELEKLCLAIAVLLHYFYLVSFFIMLAKGVDTLLMVLIPLHVRRWRETAALLTTAWVLPAVIVCISLGVTKTAGYVSKTSCWLSVESHLIWAFVAPAFSILLVNCVFLVVLIYKLRTRMASTKSVQQNNVRSTIWNIIILCPVLGITWVFGVLSINSKLVVFQYIFAIANSFQGVFVFIFHALYRNMQNTPDGCSARCLLFFDRSGSKSSVSKTSKTASNARSKTGSVQTIVASPRNSSSEYPSIDTPSFSDIPTSPCQSVIQYEGFECPDYDDEPSSGLVRSDSPPEMTGSYADINPESKPVEDHSPLEYDNQGQAVDEVDVNVP